VKISEKIIHWFERRFGIHVENGYGYIDHGGCREYVGKPTGEEPQTPEPVYQKKEYHYIV
jgi:hypothetical protein